MNKPINLDNMLNTTLRYANFILRQIGHNKEDCWHKVEFWVETKDKKIITMANVRVVSGLVPEQNTKEGTLCPWKFIDNG